MKQIFNVDNTLKEYFSVLDYQKVYDLVKINKFVIVELKDITESPRLNAELVLTRYENYITIVMIHLSSRIYRTIQREIKDDKEVKI